MTRYFGDIVTDAEFNFLSDREDERRLAIIDASRTRDRSKLPDLLSLLNADTYSNRRHITRALGNLVGDEARRTLLELLGHEKGLILGDIARSLGRLRVIGALPYLKSIQDHQLV